jgi:hypothetical protein
VLSGAVFEVGALVRPVPGGRGGALYARCDAEASGLNGNVRDQVWQGVLGTPRGPPVEVVRPS